MFTFLTADDEPDKLEALRDMFDWKHFDIELVGEAQNGPEAYSQVMKLRPDVCIIDIRMPGFSGLEVIQKATENGSHTKFIVLTGYDDFDYARKALHLQIVEYLLKPCRYEEIMQAVLKAVNQVEEEHTRKKILDDYRQLSDSNAKALRERFLVRLAAGGAQMSESVEKSVGAYKLGALFACYAVCVISLADGESGGEPQLSQELLRMIGSLFAAVGESEVFVRKEQIVVVVSLSNITEQFYQFQSALFTALEEIGGRFGMQGVIGISDLKEGPRKLHEAYTEAAKAANLAVFDGMRGVRYFAELNPVTEVVYSSQKEKDVITAVIGKGGDVQPAVDRFFDNYSLTSPESRKIIQQMASTLACSIFKVCLEHNLIFNLFSKLLSDTIEEIAKSKTLQAIKAAVLRFALEASRSFSGSKQVSAVASMAIQYIHEHYTSKITLEKAADMLHISPAYLSMLFKQQTGVNFIEYLNRYRIQQSKEYLKNIDKKVYEVADMIGIQDEKYFHSLFKRYTGLTATQYRDSLLYNHSQGKFS